MFLCKGVVSYLDITGNLKGFNPKLKALFIIRGGVFVWGFLLTDWLCSECI